MAAIALTEQNLFELKKALIKARLGVRSFHLTEAVAAALSRRRDQPLPREKILELIVAQDVHRTVRGGDGLDEDEPVALPALRRSRQAARRPR